MISNDFITITNAESKKIVTNSILWLSIVGMYQTKINEQKFVFRVSTPNQFYSLPLLFIKWKVSPEFSKITGSHVSIQSSELFYFFGSELKFENVEVLFDSLVFNALGNNCVSLIYTPSNKDLSWCNFVFSGNISNL